MPHVESQAGATWVVTRIVKIKFFRSENFNIFYDFGFAFFSEKPIRAPTWPEKNPLWPEKNFLSEENFSISEVEKSNFEQNKRRETLCMGLSPLR